MREQHQLMSSLVIFHYFEQNKKTIGEILESLIIFIMREKNLNGFTHIQICDYLDEEFGFKIPRLVVEKSLKRLVKSNENFKYKNKEFYVNENKEFYVNEIESIKKEIEKAINEENQLLEKLYNFIDKNATHEDKIEIKNDFINYFLGNIQNKYKNNINAFIIQNNKDEILKSISNGIILYDGLRYQNTFEGRSWETLNIFVNMEIIFHYMGYNGTIYKQIADELFELINEINKNKNKKLICLCYTAAEKSRIEDFFNGVESNPWKQNNTASQKIIEKCGKDALKIRNELKNLFYKLENFGIKERKLPVIDFNEEKNKKYNIISESFKRDVITSLNNEDIDYDEILGFLNKINILRANDKSTIENSKYLFLTDDKNYFKISALIKQKFDYIIPLSVQTSYLTNILWRKLGKAFSSKDKMPLIFQPDTRAKISIALEIHNHSNLLYKEVDKKKEEIGKERAEEILYDIKSMIKKPEDINESNVGDIQELSGANLEYFERRREKETIKYAKQETELKQAKEELFFISKRKS